MASAQRGYLTYVIIGGLLALGLTYAFWPRPMTVDMAQTIRAPLQVGLEGEGKTRVREAYLVSAPVGGRMLRIGRHAGDDVVANQTVLARIEPTDPSFLDFRSRTQAEATIKAADATRALAAAELARTRAELDYAQAELKRARTLAAKGTISESALDKAELAARIKAARVSSANAALRVRVFEWETARASLIDPSASASEQASCCISVRAPVNGKVLRVLQEDEGVIAAGTPLVEIGNPQDLEIVVDLLSEDAVRVRVGMDVLIADWGGTGTLNGKVRRVEPYGYTKVSALGVEEQRVNVVIDITDDVSKWIRLGHGYRVRPEVIIWRDADALQVPLGALFRSNDQWAVFAVVDGLADLRTIELGQRNAHAAVITKGLAAGDTIILHPGNRIEDGARVAPRDL